ncbi:hypothetical protein [Streptomyces sp. JJ36]|uniref:hypothetical protein n=1 Tax=Streptomyces sp. JJ36 TaxID=2736645 RepID=UPI001F448BA1|nr:hypothetical protein [Streptomyces sp. JJ36]MCF6525226.1 hypothetical protein [Streptomyces sp. JJ36]
MPASRCTRPRARRGALVCAAGLLAATTALAGCGDDTSGAETGWDVNEVQRAFEEGEAQSVTGETVTLSADVDEVLSPSAFVLGGADKPFLVVEKDLPPPDEGDGVRVTGTVHEFEFAQVQERLDAQLSRPLYERFEGMPYLMAEKIEEDIEE